MRRRGEGGESTPPKPTPSHSPFCAPLWRGSPSSPPQGGEEDRERGSQGSCSHPKSLLDPRENSTAPWTVGRERTRNADSSDRPLGIHRQPRPTHAGPNGGRPSPSPEAVEEGEPRGRPLGRMDLHLGGRRPGGLACDSPSRGKSPTRGLASRLIAKRPSDRRSPGRNPGPQGAFEVSMINVSCNSH